MSMRELVGSRSNPPLLSFDMLRMIRAFCRSVAQGEQVNVDLRRFKRRFSGELVLVTGHTDVTGGWLTGSGRRFTGSLWYRTRTQLSLTWRVLAKSPATVCAAFFSQSTTRRQGSLQRVEGVRRTRRGLRGSLDRIGSPSAPHEAPTSSVATTGRKTG